MIELKNNIAKINGVEELILRKPKSRDGLVRITQGGMAEHATEISVSDFESYTGQYFSGLEPASNKSIESEMNRLKREMEGIGFEVSEVQDIKMSGNLDFVTSQNNKFSVFFSLQETNNKKFRFNIIKGRGMSRNASLMSETVYIEHAVDNIIAKAKEYTSTMAQNLTLGEKQMASANSHERQKSVDGVPVLFPNETLSDYFDKQDMPAGMVINGKGRYQTFHSYMTYTGKMVLHYETKDYANKKNGAKALSKLGFSPEGRQLDCLNREELKEAIANGLSRELSSSWSDEKIGNFSTKNAFVTFSNILSTEDEKYGTQYFVDVVLQDRVSGKITKESVAIDPREGGNAYSIETNLKTKARDMLDRHLAGTISFIEDTRSNNEKISYHESQCDSHRRMINHYEEQLTKNDNSHYAKYAVENLSWEKEMLAKHIDMRREISPEDNEMSM